MLTLTKSTRPASSSRTAISAASSGVSPRPSRASSSPTRRMPTARCSPTAARTASSTSTQNRMRFVRLPPYPSSRKVLAATPPAIPEPRITMESSDVSRPDMNVRRLETGARCLSAADVNHGNWRWHEDHTTVRGIRRSEPNGSVALHGHCSCARAGSGFAADALDICRGRSVRGRRSKPLAFARRRTAAARHPR